MKTIKIVDSIIKESNSKLLTINKELIPIIRDEILKQGLFWFSEGTIKFYKGADGKNFWMVGGFLKTFIMSTGYYQALMRHFFNIEAFSEKEIKDLNIDSLDAFRESDLYPLAHEYLISQGQDFAPLLRKLLKDIITEDMPDSAIIISVANAIQAAAWKNNQ